MPVLLLFQRNRQDKTGGYRIAFRSKFSVVFFGNGGGDGKAQTKTGLFPAGGIRPIKAHKQMGKLLRRNGITGIGNGQPHLTVGFLQR